MKKYVVAETVTYYHMVEIDDELDIEDIVNSARQDVKNNTGYEALESKLKHYQSLYNFDYSIKPNYCGTSCTGMYVIGCGDDSPELD